MPRGPYPLMLMLAMSLPGAVRALGLGDMRVASALNEPLSAQIDIVGATRDELLALTAKVASREMFQHYGADRPGFLSSATFKVGMDVQGRPVLNVRSADPFTDPVVDFVVDLRWANGELVREYPLLLDPAGYAPAALAAAPARAAPARAAPASTAPAATEAPTAPLATPAATPAVALGAVVAAATPAAHIAQSAHAAQFHRVAARDTLRAIAHRAGARSELQLQRTMIAMFRANPHAFEGNINRLHRGALIEIPSPETIAAIDASDAKREVRAQMTAWRLDGRPAAAGAHAELAAAAHPQRLPANVPTVAPVAPPVPTDATVPALQGRVQSLEASLADMHRQLASESATLHDLAQRSAAPGATPAAAPAAAAPAAMHVELMKARSPEPVVAAVSPAPTPSSTLGKSLLGGAAAGLALLLVGFAAARRRALGGSPAPQVSAFFDAEEPRAAQLLARDDGRTRDAPAPSAAPIPAAKAMAPLAPTAPAPQPRAASPEPAPSYVVVGEIQQRDLEPTTQTLAIDIEALERSYMDSLYVDTFGTDTLGLDAVNVDALGIDTAVLEGVTADTAVLEQPAPGAPAAGAAPAAATTVTATVPAPAHAPARAHTTTATSSAAAAAAAAALAAGGTPLDYNLLDLDSTAEHVHLPSELHDRKPAVERRTHFVDVLQRALERDPQRRDLRMKLLETYHNAASINQRAFMEVARKFEREHDSISREQWQRIMAMGRDIFPNEPMFSATGPAATRAKDDLADCA